MSEEKILTIKAKELIDPPTIPEQYEMAMGGFFEELAEFRKELNLIRKELNELKEKSEEKKNE